MNDTGQFVIIYDDMSFSYCLVDGRRARESAVSTGLIDARAKDTKMCPRDRGPFLCAQLVVEEEENTSYVLEQAVSNITQRSASSILYDNEPDSSWSPRSSSTELTDLDKAPRGMRRISLQYLVVPIDIQG